MIHTKKKNCLLSQYSWWNASQWLQELLHREVVWGKDEWPLRTESLTMASPEVGSLARVPACGNLSRCNYWRKQEVGKAEEVRPCFGASYEDPHEIVDMSDSSEFAFFECGGPGFSCF